MDNILYVCMYVLYVRVTWGIQGYEDMGIWGDKSTREHKQLGFCSGIRYQIKGTTTTTIESRGMSMSGTKQSRYRKTDKVSGSDTNPHNRNLKNGDKKERDQEIKPYIQLYDAVALLSITINPSECAEKIASTGNCGEFTSFIEEAVPMRGGGGGEEESCSCPRWWWW